MAPLSFLDIFAPFVAHLTLIVNKQAAVLAEGVCRKAFLCMC